MIKYIAVDPGKFSTKAVKFRQDGADKSLLFRSKLEETIKNEAQGKSYIVTYCGKKYLIGEQAEVNSAKSSKAEELHRICTYTALHQLGNSGEELVVAIGCPLATFENPESREAYKRFMFPDKQIDIKVGDLVKHLYIKSVIVLPESSVVVNLEPEKYAKGLVGVVDLGGLNINACAYNRGLPVLSTLYTDTLGSNVLTQNLKNALSTKYNEDIPQFMMDDIVNEGYVIDNMREDGIKDGSKEFIADFKKRHIQTILKKCEANGWNLSMMRLVFTGGTSQMLASEIKELLPGATIYSYKLLIIDELGYQRMDTDSANLFFNLISKRYEKSSTIITTNSPFSKWADIFQEPVLTNALLDRLLHHCSVININGPSYRLKDQLQHMAEDRA